MILKSLNKNISKFGFAEELAYDDSGSHKFNGHQKGVAICITNHHTGEVEVNHLPQALANRDDALKEIINDSTIVKLVSTINQVENGMLVAKDVYYLPYYVDNHVCFKPTINFENIAGEQNVEYAADIELLFVYGNMNRYATLHVITTNVSLMDCVYNIIHNEDVLADLGVVKSKGSNDEYLFSLDFYDETGERTMVCFEYAETLRDQLVSFRLIGLRKKQVDANAQ